MGILASLAGFADLTKSYIISDFQECKYPPVIEMSARNAAVVNAPKLKGNYRYALNNISEYTTRQISFLLIEHVIFQVS